MQRRKLVIANWKMHGSNDANAALIGAILAGLPQPEAAELALCVPYPYLGRVGQLLAGSNIMLGAQSVSEFSSGAYSGDVSASMLKEVGCGCVIVGHSERRSMHRETDQQVASKAAAALAQQLMPIVCVGETLEERESALTPSVIAAQLDAVMAQIGAAGVSRCVIAYEPVWAIGTGRTATPQQAAEVHAFIRGRVARLDSAVAQSVRIVYGGSVKAVNARELFACPDIDGGLIGSASLAAAEFLAIVAAAA